MLLVASCSWVQLRCLRTSARIWQAVAMVLQVISAPPCLLPPLPLHPHACCHPCLPALACSNLTRELLDYLAVCDGEFKPDLTAKIATLIQRYAPDKRWHIDSMLQVGAAQLVLEACFVGRGLWCDVLLGARKGDQVPCCWCASLNCSRLQSIIETVRSCRNMHPVNVLARSCGGQRSITIQCSTARRTEVPSTSTVAVSGSCQLMLSLLSVHMVVLLCAMLLSGAGAGWRARQGGGGARADRADQ